MKEIEEIEKIKKDFEHKKDLIVKQKLRVEHLEDEAEMYRDDEKIFSEYGKKIEEEKQNLYNLDMDYKRTRSDANLKRITKLILQLNEEKNNLEIEIDALEITLKQIKHEYLKFLDNPIDAKKKSADYLKEQEDVEINIAEKKKRISEIEKEKSTISDFLDNIKEISLTKEEFYKINEKTEIPEITQEDKEEEPKQEKENKSDDLKLDNEEQDDIVNFYPIELPKKTILEKMQDLSKSIKTKIKNYIHKRKRERKKINYVDTIDVLSEEEGQEKINTDEIKTKEAMFKEKLATQGIEKKEGYKKEERKESTDYKGLEH